MANNKNRENVKEIENREWLDSLNYVFESQGPKRVRELMHLLQIQAKKYDVEMSCPATSPYLNTIPRHKQPPYPGSREIERRIKSINRWNAMAMVVRANRESSGIGGHISTYASQATLFEVAFNHFLRAKSDSQPGDIVYYQGHASPGIYARAFLEGRLTEQDLHNFRRELRPDGGLSSYPHPWLMPEFWEYPTVSMGLSPIMAIYQARFIRYMEDRGIKEPSDQKVWAFLGDGEMDEPESMGAITLASREKLDNLIFVISCNLQRLDGPVRGNGSIIQELEAAFRGARWNVIKVIWGDDWDELLEKDKNNVLADVMENLVDGERQKFIVSDGQYIRENFFGKDPRLKEMVKNYSDEQLEKLRRGGHDPEKVYAAYQAAVNDADAPTVILAQTVKGYGLGEAGEGRNVTHQQKKLNEEELRQFRGRFGIPISDKDLAEAPFYKPADDSEEMKYLHERRKALGGYVPARKFKEEKLKIPSESVFEEFYKGNEDREEATTMVFVHLLSKLLKDKNIGKRIVPIVPDEARTFGMEALFRQVGIYSHTGQLYEPVDRENLLYYREIKDGAILEEGITEAGSMSSFIAAGTSYSSQEITMIPFFLFYSMFGFQRIGDLIWAAGDARARGFMAGGTSGRTTLPGEGLQHQDGNSHALAYPVPNLKAYDPAYAYEIAVIVQDGLKRMYEDHEDWIYYLTIMNEFYKQPAMPKNSREGILKGMYKFKASEQNDSKKKVHLFGSGAILNEVVKAQKLLEEKYKVSADVWSVTSYKELYRDATDTDRWNMLNPGKKEQIPYIGECLKDAKGVFVAASDYLKALPASIAKWIPGPFTLLGTDGFGRSEAREELREFFEVDHRFITLAALHSLAQQKDIKPDVVKKAMKDLDIDPDKPNPVLS
ncbi:pyruvate dehydrogenase (acetyl-transferring), homodimeric type [candidate division KSB1 bacterium]|nr:pyruvate dehydrogenase (acetyl-transferring), homodimeric type [candidate division KSB1 bacterium]